VEPGQALGESLQIGQRGRRWLGVPVCHGDTRRGTLCLCWDNVITYREDLVRRA
jgi:hypothetical protein